MTKFEDYLIGLTADATPDGAADYLVSYDASASASKKVLINNLPVSGGGLPIDGWVVAGDTWVYASADGPTFTFTIAGVDRTNLLQAGMRVKLTQTTAKYFIITKVAFSTNTTVTIYGGTDYTLANAAITSPYYSPCKAPFGFNTDPAKWTVKVTDTSSRTQSTPAANTWYNLGAVSISIPIGAWLVRYEVGAQYSGTTLTPILYVTLSTANNSETDKEFTSWGDSGTITLLYLAGREKNLLLASKTSYYLNTECTTADSVSIFNRGDLLTTVIRAVCAYL